MRSETAIHRSGAWRYAAQRDEQFLREGWRAPGRADVSASRSRGVQTEPQGRHPIRARADDVDRRRAQFGLMLRQMDVIGKWAPVAAKRKLPASVAVVDLPAINPAGR